MTQKIINMLANKDPIKDIFPDRNTLLQILDSMFDELYVLDGQNTCIYVNKACEKHYGVKQEQIIGAKLSESVRSGYWSPGIGMIAAKEKRIATYEMTTNKGKTLTVTATPVFDENGKLKMVVENLRDVSHLLQVQSDIQATTALFTKYYTQELPPLLSEAKEYLVMKSESMQKVKRIATLAAASSANILLTGPTGCGKNMLARYIHEISSASGGPFVVINCSAIPDQLFESELFGYAPGAFSGASSKGKRGIVSMAKGGTLLLDEVNSIPLSLQPKILHFLQEHVYAPVGSNKAVRANCRILAATNQKLEDLVKREKFRADLYYRLCVLEISVPGLKDRKKDIIPLAEKFVAKFNKKMGVNRELTKPAYEWLTRRIWEGNVRELENFIERMIALSGNGRIDVEWIEDLILPQTFAPEPEETENSAAGRSFALGETSLVEALAAVEKKLLERAWERCKNSYGVAKILGISQNKAYRLLRKYNINCPA